MTNRYNPNEPVVLSRLNLMALLLRAPEERVVEMAWEMPERQRAALAIHCVARTHMRPIALVIAAECSERALWQAGGRVGQILFEQCQDRAAFDREPSRSQRGRYRWRRSPNATVGILALYHALGLLRTLRSSASNPCDPSEVLLSIS